MTAEAVASSRPTRAVVDLSAVAGNYRYLVQCAGRAQVIPVVKANAYGHGSVAVARRLEREGARRFAVAVPSEGIELRRAGVRGEILILNFSDSADIPLLHGYGLVPTLFDLEQARAFSQRSRGLSPPLPVHLKVDTGMGRLGILPQDVAEAAGLLKASPGLTLTGTTTQLARADEPGPEAVRRQIETLQACLGALKDAGLDPGTVHAANSAGLLSHPETLFDAVRPGLALYGIPPSESQEDRGLSPAMEIETRVMTVKAVSAGTPLGYGGRFVTSRPSAIAVLPIGYHDGVRRSFSGRVSVLLRGGRAPIVGAVSMDLTLIDATETGARREDRVVLLGRDGGLRITAWDLARADRTIPYEIVCGVGSRVPRVYADAGAAP